MRHKLFLLLFLLLPITALATLKVVAVHVTPNKKILDITGFPSYHFFTLSKPNRLVVDIKNAKWVVRGVKKNVRHGQHKAGKLRIVFSLKKTAKFKSRVTKSKYYQLILYSKTKIKPAVTLPQHTKLRNVVIVIDPGHGGKDPGATGSRGTHEKDVVFAIAEYLQQMLNQQHGFKAWLTRKGDYFIPLRQRLSIAIKDRGDMFVAIHADAYKDPYAQGASVFALSLRGATSEAARWLAQKENESELGDVLTDKNKILRSVLINLAQTASISTSLKIGKAMIVQLSRVTKLHHDFIEQAAFIVLKEPDIPSLLVETGFISNSEEELRLRNPEYQRNIAKALMLGIRNYFVQHPPRGTYLYANKNSGSTIN